MATCTCSTPPAIALERARMKALGIPFLGCCGDINHRYGFHMPGCATSSDDYSRRYGLGNPLWAAGLDVGMKFAHSRDWLVWLVAQATAGRIPGLVEIIGKPAGKPSLYWAKWNGWKPRTYTGKDPHDTHTHCGFDRTVLARGAAVDLGLFDWTAGGGTPAPSPAKPATVAAEIRAARALPVLRKGNSGGYVRNLQGLLLANGRGITVDGKFGPATDKALRAEQSEHKLTRDGIAGPQSWSTLLARRAVASPVALPTLRRGTSGGHVRNLQGLLIANGRGVKCDGAFGPATEAAVKAEQREYGIGVDGVAGDHTHGTLIARRRY